MALVCSISNEVPEEPVLSPVSNHVFEKRLIVKFIQQTGNDPVNGEPLSEEQLLDIKIDPMVKARPPTATSIPAILKLLQDEWDACMLHTFTLRQQLQTARQELSHALYQHDAACRVIARLTKEVTAAREALATLKPQAAGTVPQAPEQQDEEPVQAAPETMETEAAPGEMTAEILQKLQDTAGLLTAERKKRGKKPPESLTAAEDISNFQQLSSHPGLHSASTPGILALDLSGDTTRALTGGADKLAVVFDKESEKIVATLKGHSKKVTSVIHHPRENVAITASPDTTIRVWDIDSGTASSVIKTHEGPVTGISLHATGDFLLSCSTDQLWAFSDIRSGRLVSMANDPDSAALTCAQFHPDGLIFGTGTADSVVKIWDLRQKSNAANFPGHSGQISTIAFSENGYYLASAAEEAAVKLWDLRKLRNFKTLDLEQGGQVESVSFDQTGTYLAVAGNGIQVYHCKQWNILKSFTDHSAPVTGIRFGLNSSFIASVSMDRSLRYFGQQ